MTSKMKSLPRAEHAPNNKEKVPPSLNTKVNSLCQYANHTPYPEMIIQSNLSDGNSTQSSNKEEKPSQNITTSVSSTPPPS